MTRKPSTPQNGRALRIAPLCLFLALAALMSTPMRWQAAALVLLFFGLRAVLKGDLLAGAVLIGLSFGPFMAAMDAWYGKPLFDQMVVGVSCGAFGVAVCTTLWQLLPRKRANA